MSQFVLQVNIAREQNHHWAPIRSKNAIEI
jgi:hypothetical protein